MIDSEAVKHLGHLARIDLKPEEVETLTKNLATVINYVEALKQVNTDGLPEVTQVTGLKNILRNDDESCDVCASYDTEKLISSAPASERGYLKVKGVFENTEE